MQLSSLFHQTLPACNMNIFQTPQIEFGRDFCCTFLVSKLNLRCWWHHCDIIRVMFSSRSRRHHTAAFTAWEQLNMSRKLIFMFETRGVNCEYWKHWPQIVPVSYDAHCLIFTSVEWWTHIAHKPIRSMRWHLMCRCNSGSWQISCLTPQNERLLQTVSSHVTAVSHKLNG